MKEFFRISGLLFSVLLLITLVPDTVGWQLSGNEHLKMLSPVSVVSPAISSVPKVSDFLTPEPSSPSGMPEATAQPSPGPALALPGDDHLLELREIRRALANRPTSVSVPTANPTPALAVIGATPVVGAKTPTPVPSVKPPAPTPTLPPDAFETFIHLPPNSAQHQPLRVLLVLHGMGARGDIFSQNLLADADRNNWVVVAPTLPYNRDYMDPNQLMQEDLRLAQALHTLLDNLPRRLGLKLRSHALVYGFSRGAQLAHRLAFFFPEHVESVAMFSAGSYTMPEANESGNGSKVLAFPYGVGDFSKLLGAPEDWVRLKTISFWIGVGEKDNHPNDVSRAFDPYQGRTRVERAQAFDKALKALGIDVHLTIFPNVGHEVTTEMCNAGLQFLRKDELADNWND